MPAMLPPEPLVRFARAGWERLSASQQSYIFKLNQFPGRRVAWWKADEIAVQLGYNPAEVWGEDWWRDA